MNLCLPFHEGLFLWWRALLTYLKNNRHNLSTLTLNHAWKSNANCPAVSPRLVINFLKALCIICNGQCKNSNSSLNHVSLKFSSKFLKIALLILSPSVEVLDNHDKGTDKPSSSSSFNNISVISTAFALTKWIEVKYFITTWFPPSSQNLRRTSICFLSWWVVVSSILFIYFSLIHYLQSNKIV